MEVSLGVIFLAGVLTFFTPCILPLLPVYISLLVGEEVEEIARNRFKRISLLLNSFSFLLGLSLVFVLLGISATALGSFFLKNKDVLRGLGGLLIFVFGLKFLGYLNVDFLDYEKRFSAQKVNTGVRALNSFLIGFFFAFGWSPCLGPVLGSILTYTAVATSQALRGGFYLMVYSLGFALPMVLLAVFMEPFLRFLKRARKWIPVVEKTMGIILVAMGILLVINKASWLEVNLKIPRSGKPQACETQGLCAAEGLPPAPPSLPQTSEERTVELPKGIPVVVEFYSPKCTVCMKMVPVINALKRECQGENFKLVQVDITDPAAQELVRKFGIFGTPTFVFLDPKGKEAARLLGYQDLRNMLSTLKAIIPGGKCRDFTPAGKGN